MGGWTLHFPALPADRWLEFPTARARDCRGKLIDDSVEPVAERRLIASDLKGAGTWSQSRWLGHLTDRLAVNIERNVGSVGRNGDVVENAAREAGAGGNHLMVSASAAVCPKLELKLDLTVDSPVENA